MLKTILLLGTGGFIGSNLRYFAGKLVQSISGNEFPWGTFIINITGSTLLGFIFFISLSGNKISENTRLFLGTGLLGAFTTFSTFSLETVQLFKKGLGLQAGLNIVLNLGVGLLGVLGGMALAKLILSR